MVSRARAGARRAERRGLSLSPQTVMLLADKSALQTDLAVSLTNLQWKELEYLHTNLRNLATSSAVLVSFGFVRAGIGTSLSDLYGHDTQDNIFDNPGEIVKHGLKVAAIVLEALIGTTLSLAIGFNLLTLFVATITAMAGPGLALRGPEGSVTRSLMHMEKQNRRALKSFGRGIFAFSLHLALLSTRSLFGLAFIDGITSSLIGIYVIITLRRYGADIGERFYVSPTRMVRGAFTSTERGEQQWGPTDAERAACQANVWRPPGHTFMTPLVRLDKLITFHWTHEEASGRLQQMEAGERRRAPLEPEHSQTAQVEGLVQRMQGTFGNSHSALRPPGAAHGATSGAISGSCAAVAPLEGQPPVSERLHDLRRSYDVLEHFAARMDALRTDLRPLISEEPLGHGGAAPRGGWWQQVLGIGGADQPPPVSHAPRPSGGVMAGSIQAPSGAGAVPLLADGLAASNDVTTSRSYLPPLHQRAVEEYDPELGARTHNSRS